MVFYRSDPSPVSCIPTPLHSTCMSRTVVLCQSDPSIRIVTTDSFVSRYVLIIVITDLASKRSFLPKQSVSGTVSTDLPLKDRQCRYFFGRSFLPIWSLTSMVYTDTLVPMFFPTIVFSTNVFPTIVFNESDPPQASFIFIPFYTDNFYRFFSNCRFHRSDLSRASLLPTPFVSIPFYG